MHARLNGIDVYYEQRGSGPRLLFLNGSGSSIESSGVIIDGLATGFEVLVHDQRGLGRTEVPSTAATMADYATDAKALLDHVGWSSCRVVGISFGGMVAQELAVTWPGLVERLALLCTSPGGEGGSSYPLHELGELPDDEAAAKAVQLLDTRFSPEWLASHPKDRGLVEYFAEQTGAPKTDAARRGAAVQLGARRDHDVCARLGAITCPTFVAAGRFDGIAPVANSQAIVDRVPGAELRVYDGGHAFLVQDARAFPDVLGFLA